MSIFKAADEYRTPSLSGYLGLPIIHEGKKFYPVTLTLKPGTLQYIFERFFCNCPIYIPKKLSANSLVWNVYSEPPKILPDHEVRNPYIHSVPLGPNSRPVEILLFVVPGEKDVIEFEVKTRARIFGKTLTWAQSVV